MNSFPSFTANASSNGFFQSIPVSPSVSIKRKKGTIKWDGGKLNFYFEPIQFFYSNKLYFHSASYFKIIPWENTTCDAELSLSLWFLLDEIQCPCEMLSLFTFGFKELAVFDLIESLAVGVGSPNKSSHVAARGPPVLDPVSTPGGRWRETAVYS